jgi:FMN reductase
MSTLRLVAVTAGMGQPSSTRLLTDRLIQATRRELADRGTEAKTETIELRDLAVDIATAMTTGFPAGRLREALDAVAQADGLIAVTPIFSASYSGLFKSFFDILDRNALTGTPTLIAATGGTARHSLALEHSMRPLFSYLRALVVPTAVYAASEDWGNTDGLITRIDRAAAELADQLTGRPAGAGADAGADAGAENRSSRVAPVDEFDDVIPFEQRFAAVRTKARP